MAENQISHQGIVTEVSGQAATVRIQVEEACAACKASALCGMTSMKEKDVSVRLAPGRNVSVGDEVTVRMHTSMGRKAVLLSYGLPLVVLLAVALPLSAAGTGELVTALAGVGAVALYYLVLWLFRDRLSETVVFYIDE